MLITAVYNRGDMRLYINGKAEAQGKYKKQSGGRGQYGDAHLRLEPKPRGEGFEFVNAITGGVIPSKFIPAVEKGAFETTQEGVLANYPIVDVKVTVFFGSYHNVDSSEMAFKVAGSICFRNAAKQGNPVMLEPVMNVEIVTPEDFFGDVMGNVNSRRGQIYESGDRGMAKFIKAMIPLAEMFGYATDLRSMTQGRANYTMEFDHYEKVPGNVAEKLIANKS